MESTHILFANLSITLALIAIVISIYAMDRKAKRSWREVVKLNPVDKKDGEPPVNFVFTPSDYLLGQYVWSHDRYYFKPSENVGFLDTITIDAIAAAGKEINNED